jgi:NO-binding membrane sensor protein with MHYT domain
VSQLIDVDEYGTLVGGGVVAGRGGWGLHWVCFAAFETASDTTGGRAATASIIFCFQFCWLFEPFVLESA